MAVKELRRFIDDTAEKYAISSIEDWYSVKINNIENSEWNKLQNNRHRISFSDQLMKTYPDTHWRQWRFGNLPFEFWSKTCNQIEFIDSILLKFDISDIDYWYEVITTETVRQFNGTSLLSELYRGSIWKMVTTLFPNYNWQFWRFEHAPNGFWTDNQNQRNYFDWLAEIWDINSIDQWYKVRAEDISKKGGSGVLNDYYDNSLVKALFSMYPDTDWQPWRFDRCPDSYWNILDHRTNFFRNLEDLMKIERNEDWYLLTINDIKKHGGGGILNLFDGSLHHALNESIVNSNFQWKPWKFRLVSPGFWNVSKNHLEFFDWLAEELSIDRIEDWYNLTLETIYEKGGKGLLSGYYDDSPSKALASIYPDTKWHPWRFHHTPQRFWNSWNNQKECLEWLEDELKIDKMEDWYNVSNQILESYCGVGLLEQYDGSLVQLLKTHRSNIHWNPWGWTLRDRMDEL